MNVYMSAKYGRIQPSFNPLDSLSASPPDFVLSLCEDISLSFFTTYGVDTKIKPFTTLTTYDVRIDDLTI